MISRCEQERRKKFWENTGEGGIQKQRTKMDVLITERSEITPLLGMDWMKTCEVTIGGIQLAKNNQSEKQKIIINILD